MKLIEKALHELNTDFQDVESMNVATIVEQFPKGLEIIANILNVPCISTKTEYEERYVADFVQNANENDDEYQFRLSKLNEAKLIPSIDRQTEKKILFCIDPTKQELDSFCNLNYGIMSLSTYKEITGFNSTLSLIFDETEEMPSYLKKLFKFCHESKATDIDLTTMQSSISIKLKVSGEWTDPIGTIPIAYKNKALISLCSLSNPNPVDYKSGKELKFRVGQEIDGINILFRVAVFPTTFGENVAIRKLPGVGTLPKLENLGLSNNVLGFLNSIVNQINSPKKGGVVFITGETGSGKSTLLSGIISEYLLLNKKVNTSEDPVENKLSHPFLNQTEVGEDARITHMDALAGFLRQNSDVIVIGECRKPDELLAVINAGLSGHYTFTTLHTGSVEETLLRLEAMGIDLTLIAGILKGVVSMSLIPKLCNDCKIKVDELDELYSKENLELYAKENPILFKNSKPTFYIRNLHSKDCKCKGRGVIGVVPVNESAPFGSSEIKKLIGNVSIQQVIEEIKKQDGYISMNSQINRNKGLGLIDARMQNVI